MYIVVQLNTTSYCNIVFFSQGKSWTHPEKTDLPNNNAAIQANVLSSKNVVLCFNPTTGPRDIMRIAVSQDGGKTWPHYKVLRSQAFHSALHIYVSEFNSLMAHIMI